MTRETQQIGPLRRHGAANSAIVPRMLHLILYEPEIPPNTGNLMRLCANTGLQLHLVGTLGFELEDRRLRRAGLDYRDLAVVQQHQDWSQFLLRWSGGQLYGLSTKGQKRYDQVAFAAGDGLLFGPETRGLPATLLSDPELTAVLRLPMQPESRSLNLSNAAAIVAFEALRQLDFPSLV